MKRNSMIRDEDIRIKYLKVSRIITTDMLVAAADSDSGKKCCNGNFKSSADLVYLVKSSEVCHEIKSLIHHPTCLRNGKEEIKRR